MSKEGLAKDPKNVDIGIQGFAPRQIVSVAAGATVNVSGWTAYCCPGGNVTVQLNATGGTVVLEAGTVRCVPAEVTTIKFTGFTGSVSIEVM